MRSTVALGLAVGLVVVAAVLAMLPRLRRDRDAAAALSTRRTTEDGRPLGRRMEPSAGFGEGRPHQELAGRVGTLGPRARAPTAEEIAAAMVLLAVALQSGIGVVEAMENAARVAPPVPGAELSVVAAALRWGVAEERAWAEVDPAWSRAALALRMASEAGVAPSTLLLSGAEDLRLARLATIDVAGARLGVRLVVPLGVAFLPAFVLTTVVPVVLALTHQVLAA
jgi:hypothetical protein